MIIEKSFFAFLFPANESNKIKSDLKSQEDIKLKELEIKLENEWYQEYELIYRAYSFEN